MSDTETSNPQMVGEVHQPDAGPAGGGNPLLSLDPGLVVWVWVVFTAFVLILWRFAWKPLTALLAERKGDIEKTLDDVESARKSLEEASGKQRQLIEEGHQRAAEIVLRADQSSRKLAEEIRDKAKEESERMLENARVQIERQKEEAISDLKNEVVHLAVSVASQLIESNLDDDLNETLVKNYIEEISD